MTPEALQTPLAVLRRVFGYPSFRGQQQEIVEHVVAGGDALVLMPTGGGKSLCYQLPALLRPGARRRRLAADRADEGPGRRAAPGRRARRRAQFRAAAGEAGAVERAAREGALDLLYVAPERLVMPRCLDLLRRCRIALFAIDEAHCVSQWGHDFRREYQALGILKERFPEVPRIALTATADGPTRRDIAARLHLEAARLFAAGFDRPNLFYRVVAEAQRRATICCAFSTTSIRATPASSIACPGARSRRPPPG